MDGNHFHDVRGECHDPQLVQAGQVGNQTAINVQRALEEARKALEIFNKQSPSKPKE